MADQQQQLPPPLYYTYQFSIEGEITVPSEEGEQMAHQQAVELLAHLTLTKGGYEKLVLLGIQAQFKQIERESGGRGGGKS